MSSDASKPPHAPLPVEIDGAASLRELRLAIYQTFVERGVAPSPAGLCARFDLTPDALDRAIVELAEQHSALVLMPGSPYLWMAEPFSAVPTHFPVTAGGVTYYGNCIWDALAILALLCKHGPDEDGTVSVDSPIDGHRLSFVVKKGQLEPVDAHIHFAVAAKDWWRSIGFT